MKPTSMHLLPVDWRSDETAMEFRALLRERSDLGNRLHSAGNRLEFALLSRPIRTDPHRTGPRRTQLLRGSPDPTGQYRGNHGMTRRSRPLGPYSAKRIAATTAARWGDPIERFWSHVDKTQGPVACWVWTASRNSRDYGLFSWRRSRSRLAHRIAYGLVVGPVPLELHVLHHCDNPPCVNPTHLWLGTDADNVHDMDAKGRRRVVATRGEQSPFALLTDDAVRLIRIGLSQGRTYRSVGAEFGVDKSTIGRLARGETWTHVS